MAEIAALFGGQGSQYPGMGRKLYEESARAREIYAMAGDILGFDVARVSFEEESETLAATGVAQPVIFTHAVAAFAVAREYLPSPGAVAGHSLGEYAALCCAGAFSTEDGFRIIGARARVMGNAAKTAKGTMIAISGLTAEEVSAACEGVGEAWAVNFNLPEQTVISGRESACLDVADTLAKKGARVTRLNVDSAFHTPLMDAAAKEFRELTSGIRYAPAGLDFYSNVTGKKLVIEDYPDYFARHMVSPVLFVEEIGAMVSDGIDTCVEYGPKKTAATLARRNSKTLRTFSAESIADMEKIAKGLATSA